MLMGVYMRWLRPGRVLEASAIGLVLLVRRAVRRPLGGASSRRSRRCSRSSGTTLAIAIMVYGFAASVIPVWLLLAPRDYLSAFVKIGVVIALAVGHPHRAPAAPDAGAHAVHRRHRAGVRRAELFPFAFITIACGAISGFHALIASGTTPKLLEREGDARLIGYGGMLMESFVAVMALIAACALTPGVYFAINAPASAHRHHGRRARRRPIASWGFVVTPAELETLARQVGESSLLSRTGGAPSLAVGMAHIFSRVLGGDGGDGALVPLRHHVRGAVHPHHARRRHARRPLHAAGPRQARLGAVRPQRRGIPPS